MLRDIEAQLETRQLRRMRAEPAQIARLDRQMDAAEALIGELQGEAGHRFYINLLTAKGHFTGKIRESRSKAELVSFLIRNRYV
jgi:hypothetical protein